MIRDNKALITCRPCFTIADSPLDAIPEFAQLCGRLLGRKWELAAGIASLGAITGAVIVYWVLMSNFLFLTVNWIELKSHTFIDTGSRTCKFEL